MLKAGYYIYHPVHSPEVLCEMAMIYTVLYGTIDCKESG